MRRSDAPAAQRPNLGFFLLNAACFFALARRAPERVVDTTTYLQHAMHRTPGYPLFLDLARLVAGLFGGDHALKAAQLGQLLVGFLGAAHLSRTLRESFRLPLALTWAMHLLLLFPQVRFGHLLATESLSHGLFLLLLSFLTRSFLRREVGPVVGVALSLGALVLVRPQFVFLFPLSLPYLGWLLYTRRGARRANLLAGALLLLMLPGSVLAQATYNYAYSGRFARIPFTGPQAVAVALYLAEPADAALVPEGAERRYFEAASRQIEEGRWSVRHRGPYDGYFEHFNMHYGPIYLDAVVPGYLRLVGRTALSSDDWVAFDRMTLDLTLRLFTRHGKGLAFHALKQMQETGGYLPLGMLFMIALPLALYLRTGWAGALPAVAVGLMGLTNYLLVSLLEPLGTRYTMYTEQVQLPFAIALCVYLTRFGAPPAGVTVPVPVPPRRDAGRGLGESGAA